MGPGEPTPAQVAAAAHGQRDRDRSGAEGVAALRWRACRTEPVTRITLHLAASPAQLDLGLWRLLESAATACERVACSVCDEGVVWSLCVRPDASANLLRRLRRAAARRAVKLDVRRDLSRVELGDASLAAYLRCAAVLEEAGIPPVDGWMSSGGGTLLLPRRDSDRAMAVCCGILEAGCDPS